MLLARWTWIPTLVVALGAPAPASAGLVSRFFKKVGGGLTEGAVEKLDPVLTRTLADVDSRVTKHESQIAGHIDNLIGKTSNEVGNRLEQVDGILEKRLLQIRVGADEVLDHGLDKIDLIAEQRLQQLNQGLAARVEQLNKDVKDRLQQADEILEKRIADIRQVVTDAIGQADVAIAERIEQLDEVAGRRLMNVDVIATKQRLGLETTITRAAWLVALVVFVVFLLRALWSEYVEADKQAAKAEAGIHRALFYVKVMGKSLLRHAAVGTAVAVLLATLPSQLPSAAGKELQSVTDHHAAGLAAALTELDWTRVRFHSSQLEILQPTDVAKHRAMVAKADLLEDLLGRETALLTNADVGNALERVQALERIDTGRPDPDALTVRAMILWQQGPTKAQAHQAATLAARALWGNPRGFTLAPMARLLIEAYLDAPEPDAGMLALDGESAEPAAGAQDLESNKGLLQAKDLSSRPARGTPFEGADVLYHLISALQRTSNEAFVAMVMAQAEVTRAKPDARAAALKRRNAAAERIVKAWKDFDRELQSSPALANNTLVLTVFRLNDAVLTHALWFALQPKKTEWPRRLASMTKPADTALKLAIAPARTVWARRYAGMLKGPARSLVELQEARRFEGMESLIMQFEQAYQDSGCPASELHAKGRCQANSLQELDSQVKAASVAAALGLYEGEPDNRRPVALAITGNLADLQRRIDELAEQAKTQVKRGPVQLQAKLQAQLADGIRNLREQLLTAGQSLI